MEATATVTPELGDLTAAELLGAARQSNATVQRGEADLLAVAYQWAVAHPADEDGWNAAAFSHVLGDEPISGDGTPLVAEFCVAELGAEGDERPGDRGPHAGDDRLGAEQADRPGRAHERLGGRGVDRVQPGDVEDRRRRAVLGDAGQQRLHHLLGALGVEGADQRQDDHAVGDRQQRRREL